jgi:hypothetical protein
VIPCAGYLEKQRSGAIKSFITRYYLLRGSTIFWFKRRGVLIVISVDQNNKQTNFMFQSILG